MRVKHSQMPVLPPKTYFPLYYDKDIEDRRVKLSVYLQELMNRPDFRTAQIFRTFIELDAHADKQSKTFEAKKIAEIKELKLGARDTIHLKEKGILFVAMSEMNITNRIDSYITNVSSSYL